ncbi:MAG: hypothetical protein IT529_04110 [Burkholderiales bacterium]|nr:hypothetical protein [Burkholderiales bacterium]
MAELGKRGLAAAVIVSGPFMKLATAQARTFGAPDLTLIEIPHPLGGLAIEAVKGRAALAVPQLVAMVKKLLD